MNTQTYCTHHLKCGNTDCVRKPTPEDIKRMRERDDSYKTISWGDFMIPLYGIKCQYHKPVQE